MMMKKLQKPDLLLVFVSISVKWGDSYKVNRAACVPNQFWSASTHSHTHTHLINAVNLTKFNLKCELIERRKLNFT